MTVVEMDRPRAAIRRSPTRRRGSTIAVVLTAFAVGHAATRAETAVNNGESQQPPIDVRPSIPSDEPSQLVELGRLQEQLRRLIKEAQASREAQNRRIEDLLHEQKALGRGLAVLETEAAQREQELARKKQAHAEKEQKLKQFEQRDAELRQQLLVYFDILEPHLARGIPWQKDERIAVLADARAALSGPRATASEALESVSRVQRKEEALGKSIEVKTVEVESNGRRLAVHGYHLGLVATLYVSEDATIVGRCAPGQQLMDGIMRDPVAVQENAASYTLGVDILKRRLPPVLVDLLVPPLATSARSLSEPKVGVDQKDRSK
ncbi:MAG: DUF3450 family protein [Planctomycetota bacterium]